MTSAISVFTPTFERARLLPRVYASLRAQGFRDFEWIVVDDGSSDGTGDLVRGWREEACFPIDYLWQENAGKHVAINRGVERARGELFVILDSDDWLADDALARMHAHWCSVPSAERGRYAGVVGLYAFPDGRVTGAPFPRSPLVASSVDVRVRHGKRGDSFGSNRTDLLRRFPFPEAQGRFVAESLVWNRIAREHVQLCVNEVFAYTEYQPDGLTAGSQALRIRNPEPARTNYQELLNDHELPFAFRLRTAVNYLRFSLHEGRTVRDAFRASRHRGTLALGLPAAWSAYRRDRRLVREHERDGAP